MKKLCIPLLLAAGAAWAQPPSWTAEQWRELKYPHSRYLTGFAADRGSSSASFANAVKNNAKAELIQSLQVSIQSAISHRRSRHGNDFDESIAISSSAYSEADISGMSMEYYYDSDKGMGYAFAFVSKAELAAYYKARIDMLLMQAQSGLRAARTADRAGMRAGSREAAAALAGAIRAHGLLSALDAASAANYHERIAVLSGEQAQMAAQLPQGMLIFVESSEDLFGARVSIVANRLMGILSKDGCSFVDSGGAADFTIKISASVRHAGEVEGIVFCYADVAVQLYDTRRQMVVYADEIAQKGGFNTADRAARKALDTAAANIAAQLKTWLEN